MFEVGAPENNAVFKALGDKPGKVYGCVNTNRSESRSGVYPRT